MPKEQDNNNMADFSTSFLDSFKRLDEISKEQQAPRNYSPLVDLCRATNMGTVIGRAVADCNNQPMRVITSYRELSRPAVDDQGTAFRKRLRWMDSSNYKQITQDQKVLNDKIGALIKTLENLKAENPTNKLLDEIWMSYRSKFFLMYMKVKKITPDKGEAIEYDPYQATLLTHRSAGFGAALKQAIDNKISAFEGNEWLERCFSRNNPESKFLMTIHTKRPTTRYEISISIDETSKSIALTEEDLELMKDLDQEIISVDFNEDVAKDNLKVVTDILNELAQDSTIKSGLPTSQNDLTSEGASLPPLV